MKPFVRNINRPESDTAERIQTLINGIDRITDVATNAEKLALSKIGEGFVVRITGEADRLEMFVGTDPSNDEHWALVGENTINLEIYAESGTLTFNGVQLVQYAYTSIGWIKLPRLLLPDAGSAGSVFTNTLRVNGVAWGHAAQANRITIDGNLDGLVISDDFPKGATVRIAINGAI